MERAVPVLPADDITLARQFYVDKLGFRVAFEESDGKSGIMGVERGTITITIDAPMAGHGRKACVSLQVDDADRYYNEWRDKVEVQRPPQNEYWGGRTFSLHDPAGNTIFVIGPTAK